MKKEDKHALGECPYIFAEIYARIKKRHPFQVYFTSKDLTPIIRASVRIPKYMYYGTIKQMVRCNLFKKVDVKKWKILKFDVEKLLQESKNSSAWK